MAGVRLRANIVSQANIAWQVDIYDSNYSGDIVLIEDNGFSVTWERQGDGILEPVKASQAELMAYNRQDYETEFDDFVTDIVAANEKQFFMLAYKDGALNWVGNVLVDKSSYENISVPRVFRISAIDGLGRLKNIRSAEALASPTSETLITHLLDALNYNNLSQFWGTTDTYIQESFEFTELAVGALTSVQSMFLFTRFATSMNIKNLKDIDVRDSTRVRTYRDTESVKIQDTDEAITAYQVIENIMRLLCCRIMIEDGAYRIQQVRNLNGTTYESRNIVKAGTVGSAETISPQQTAGLPNIGKDLVIRSGGGFDFMQALDKAKVTTPNTFQANTLKPGQLQVNSGNTSDSATIVLGSVTGGTDKKISVLWTNYLVKLTNAGLNSVITLTFKFTFGSNRLLGANNSNTTKWTTTAADVVTRTVNYPAIGADGLREREAIISADIPSGTHTSCTLIVTVTIAALSGSLPTALNVDYIMDDLFITLADSEKFVSGAIYEVDNPDSDDNSTLLDYGVLGLADEGIVTSLNAFEVDTSKGSGTWVPSTIWNAGFGANTSLAKIIPQESMSLQRSPVMILQGPITGQWSSYKSIVYNIQGVDTIFAFNGGTFDVQEDTIDGEWFKVGVSKTSIQIDTTILKEERNNGRMPGSVNAPKRAQDWIDDSREYDTQLTTIRTRSTSGSTITSLDIFDPVHNLMKSGDTIDLFDVMDGNIIDTVTLSADVDSGDTTMSFDSITLSADVSVGVIMSHNPKLIVASQVGRFDSLQMTQAPWKKVTEVDAVTFDLEIDMYILSVIHTPTAAVAIELPLASDCWDADTSTGKEFIIFDSGANASVNNITIDVEAGSGDTIIDIATGESDTTIATDGFDLKIQCISSTKFKAY